MTKQARSPKEQPGRRVGNWGIWTFFSHSDLAISHFPAAGDSLKLFSIANAVFMKRAL
jgi:hypothetical protein